MRLYKGSNQHHINQEMKSWQPTQNNKVEPTAFWVISQNSGLLPLTPLPLSIHERSPGPRPEENLNKVRQNCYPPVLCHVRIDSNEVHAPVDLLERAVGQQDQAQVWVEPNG